MTKLNIPLPPELCFSSSEESKLLQEVMGLPRLSGRKLVILFIEKESERTFGGEKVQSPAMAAAEQSKKKKTE